MSKIIKAISLIFSLSILSIAGSILINSAIAWTNPSTTPPTNNVSNLTLTALTLSGTGSDDLEFTQTTNARYYINSVEGLQIRIDSNANDTNSEFAINNGANQEIFKVYENGITQVYKTNSKPSCSSGVVGGFIFDTVEDRPYVCTSAGWKPLDSDYDKDGIVDWNDQDDTNASLKHVNLIPDNILNGVTIFGVTGTGVAVEAPTAPQNLSITSVDNGQISLSWSAPSLGVDTLTGYKIYRGTSSGRESFLEEIGNILSYNDTTASNEVTYYYKVSAINGGGEGSLSNEDSVLIKPCYYDSDNDGYGTGSIYSYESDTCDYRLSEWANDCCDSDADAYPGSDFYSPLEVDCGGYDYNCNGSETFDTSSCYTCSVCAGSNLNACNPNSCGVGYSNVEWQCATSPTVSCGQYNSGKYCAWDFKESWTSCSTQSRRHYTGSGSDEQFCMQSVPAQSAIYNVRRAAINTRCKCN